MAMIDTTFVPTTSAAVPATPARSAGRPHDWLFDWPGFDRLFDRDTMFSAWPGLGTGRGLIKVEEEMQDDEFVVRCELPGIDPDKDVDVSVTDDTLRIEATRRSHERTASDERVRSEFSYGRFTRVLHLPRGTSAEAIRASYKDGILEVRVPLEKENTPKASKVPVTRG